MDTDEINDITYRVNGAAFAVFRELGAGFLEKVYERALLLEIRNRGIAVGTQVKMDVIYKGSIVGQYCADMMVEGKIIIEIKAVKKITRIHEAQLLNYLKATKCKYGLLINFAKLKAEIKRFIL